MSEGRTGKEKQGLEVGRGRGYSPTLRNFTSYLLVWFIFFDFNLCVL
jgi:hypothetical protein